MGRSRGGPNAEAPAADRRPWERTHALVRPPRATKNRLAGMLSAPTRPSSTTSRTGTSGARGAGSGGGDKSRSPDALVLARPGASRRRAAHAVPHRSPLARVDCAVHGSTGLRPSRRVARGCRAGSLRRSPSCGASSSSGVRRGATSGMKLGDRPLRALVVEGAPLAESHAGEVADELRSPRGLVRAGRGKRAPCEAESPAARAEARKGARCCARGASVRRLRAALRRRRPRRGSRPHTRRGLVRAEGQGRLGGRSSGRCHGGARPAPRRRARPRRPRVRPDPRGELAA